MAPSLLIDLGVTLVGTLVGVLFAFRLDRAWERRKSRESYAHALSICRYDLANAHGVGGRIRDQLKPGATNILDIEAPGLTALQRSPLFSEHGTHGLTVVLSVLSTVVAGTQNIIAHNRSAAAFGRGLTDQGVADLRDRLDRLRRAIEYAQGLIDQELRRLNFGVVGTPEDQKTIDAFTTILSG